MSIGSLDRVRLQNGVCARLKSLQLACLASLVAGCGGAALPGAGTSERPAPDGDGDGVVEVRVSGEGVAIESVSDEEGIRQWVGIPDTGWHFDHWEWIGHIVRTNGTFLDGPTEFEPNPLRAGIGSDGRLTAVFVLDEPDPPSAPPPSTSGPDAVPVQTTDEIRAGTWLIVATSDASILFATGFAVASNMLATNAHVVQGLLEVAAEPGALFGAVQHETGNFVGLETVWAHPGYDAFASHPTPDVGLVRADATLGHVLELPNAARRPDLAVFDTVRLCGFPGSVTELIDIPTLDAGSFRPRATCLEGTITALRPFDPSQPATPTNTVLIQHDISTEPGVSGSPVFLESGQIIGVHALGLGAAESEQNIAIRVDMLTELMTMVSNGRVGMALADAVLHPPVTPPSPTPSPPSTSLDGRWVGTTAQGATISFRISGYEVTDVAFGYVIASSYCSLTVPLEVCIGCVGSGFECHFSVAWGLSDNGLNAFYVFADGCNNASGSTSLFGTVAAFPPGCLGYVSDIPWTATWAGP